MSSISDGLGDVADWADKISTWSCEQLEASTLPAHGTTLEKVARYAFQIFQFCLFLPVTILVSTACFLVNRAIRWIVPQKFDPMTEFSKNPKWSGPLETVPLQKDGEPIQIGFASADIQDSGPHQKRFEETNFGRFYQKNGNQIGNLHLLPDVLNNPQPLIDECLRMGLTTYRTSISLMPKEGKRIDEVSASKYFHFFRQLHRAGIEPIVTLNHFVNPEDCDWTKPEAIDRYVNYVKSIAPDLHRSGVRTLCTFNEPAVYAFQGWIRGQFPPHQVMDFDGAAHVMENMMRAHLKAYQELKKMHPDFQIGLSHDPIRFSNSHDWNPAFAPSEKVLCHYLTEVCHSSLMRLLTTGKYSLKVPFLVNHTFEIPEFADPKTRPLDEIYLQYYTDPLIEFPWGSVTNEPGEKLTTYKYRTFAQGLASAIKEMMALGLPIRLTEIGIDTGINQDLSDKERIGYFEKIFQVVQACINMGANIKSLLWWTKDRSWEWAEGMKVDFSWYGDDRNPRPVADWLDGKLAKTRELQPNMLQRAVNYVW